MTEVDVRLRRATGLNDYLDVVSLEKEVWGDDTHIATLPMLLLADKFGGSVIVAEEASGSLVGFSFAILGREREALFWWSHMTAVKEGYRNKNIGRRLKVKQREEALAAGIEEIRWTFDPLQAVNAHFNIHKLGVIVRKYEENIYGLSESPLHRNLPTDRFVAEWRLNDEQVRTRVSGSEHAVILRDIDRIPRIIPHRNGPDREPNLTLEDDLLLLEIPTDITSLKERDLAEARKWQDQIRAAALHYLALGYVITDFILFDKEGAEAFYVLEKERR
jgi:predicted GNAT superfamily acetyltransferase